MLIPSIITARVLSSPASPADRFLPEGPRLFQFRGRETLGWVNIQTALDATTGALWLRDWKDGTQTSFELPGQPGFFVPLPGTDEVLLGLTKQICSFNLVTRDLKPLAEIPDSNPRTIINDAEATPDGKYIVFGTKDTLFKNTIAHLYLFDVAQQSIAHLADNQTCSNGKIIHLAENGYTLWDIDTPTREVRRYRLLTNPARLEYESTPLNLKNSIGFPDGMVDFGDGTVLIAFYNPEPAPFGLAVNYDLQTGAAVSEIRLPGSPRVTCPLLIQSPGGRQAVFTTATEGMPEDQLAHCPHAGSLFIANID